MSHDAPRPFDETDRPMLTTDPNIRKWIRARRQAEAWLARAEDTLKNVASYSVSPWTETRPAVPTDVVRGAVLWRPTGKPGFMGGERHDWFFVERPSETSGEFVDHLGRVQKVEGLLAEIHTEEALRKAERTERLIGNGRSSTIGIIAPLAAADRTLFVSESFHTELTKEALALEVGVDREGGVSRIFGMRVVVDPDLEGSAMRFEGPAGGTSYDPNGIKGNDLGWPDSEGEEPEGA